MDVPGCRLGDVLGEGGFATAYRATLDGREVVVKLAHAAGGPAARVMERERRLLETVGPPIAPAVLGSGLASDGRPYLIMELVAWPTLVAYRLAAGGQLPAAEVQALGVALATAVGAVHAAGLVHRDLKPANVLIGPDRAIKLLDFGIARRAGDDDTQVTGDAGTALYMSPEQCEYSAWIGAEADVYAIGVVLFELATGSPPFTAATAAELVEAHRSRRPPALEGAPALGALIRRCLAKEPSDRFADGAALAAALAQAAPPPERAASSDGAAAAPVVLTLTGGRTATVVAAPEDARGTRVSRQMAVAYLVAGGAAIDLGRLADLLPAFGGQLAQVADRRAVVVFDPDRGKTPLDSALGFAARAADALGCAAAIDFGTIELRRRAGRARFLGPDVARDASFPDDRAVGDVVLTARAAAAARVVAQPVAGTPWFAPSATEAATTIAGSPAGGAGEDLVGQRDRLARLIGGARRAFEAAAPTIASVVAEAGHGKSHLCAALAERAAAELVADVVALTAPEPLAGGEGHAALSRLLGGVLGVEPIDEATLPAALARAAGDQAAALAPLIGQALGWAVVDDPYLRRLAAIPGAAHDALVAAVGGLIRARARRRPLAIVLDDAQFADAATLDALEYAALAEAALPLWIVAAARPTFEEQRPAWGERAAAVQRERVGPLAADDAATLCRRLLEPAEAVPAGTIEALVGRSGGVPLLLVELVGGLKASGLVRQLPRGEGWYVASDEIDAAPDSPLVDWLAERRLAALSPSLARFAQLLAVLGGDFDRAEVEDVVEQLGAADAAAGLDAGVAIRRLVRDEVLAVAPDGRARFRHALVREAFERAVAPGPRQEIHAAALAVYRARDDGGEAARWRRAHHAERCGHGGEAAALYLDLAIRSAAGHAYALAERMYSRCLAQAGDEAPERTSARRGRGLMRYRIGRHADAVADLEDARVRTRAAGDREAEAHVLLDLAIALDWITQFRQSSERVDEARALVAAGADTPLLRARVSLGEGRAALRFCRYDDATRLLRRAIEEVEPLGDDGYETLVIALLLLTFTLPAAGRPAEAEATAARLVAMCEARGDRLHLASALANRRMARVARKELDGVIDDARRCLAIARELGLLELEYVVAYNLAEALYLADEIAMARGHLERALALERRRPRDETRPSAGLLELRVLAYLGDPAAALRLADLLEHQRRAAAAGASDAELMPHERVLCEMVELALADRHDAAAWARLHQEIARHAIEQEPIEVADFECLSLLRRGRAEEAAVALDRARALLATTASLMDGRIARRARALTGG